MATAKNSAKPARSAAAPWTFLTNHSHVLVCLEENHELRLREVALRVGITERAVQKIVSDLEAAGVITRIREGRRNRYEIHPEQSLRHPVETHRSVADLLSLARAERGGAKKQGRATSKRSA